MASSHQSQQLQTIIIIGEIKNNIAHFGHSFDPTYNYTEGQFRGLYMKLQRLLTKDSFQFDKVYTLESSEKVFVTTKKLMGRTMLFTTILPEGDFDNQTIEIIKSVANRGGIYTAKRFYNEMLQLRNKDKEITSYERLDYKSAIKILSDMEVEEDNLNNLANLLNTISGYNIVDNLIVYEKTNQMLELIKPEMDSDNYLDSSFMIAELYLQSNYPEEALNLYTKIAKKAQTNERLALEISCRRKAASTADTLDKDPKQILKLLEPIDDGSLEAATKSDKEAYYSIQGKCYEELGELSKAEDLHSMAIIVSETEGQPTLYVAKSYRFLGTMAAKKYQPEIATREFLTASSIASAQDNNELAKHYSHEAAKQELFWSKCLAGGSISSNISGEMNNAEFLAWQSLKRLVNAYTHSKKSLRSKDLYDESMEIVNMVERILTEKNPEYAKPTINELKEQFQFLSNGVIPKDQEEELLKFISSKISAMLPIPPPVILLIANDGRLITGGEIGKSKWNESILEDDDLFSGALSAIMAMLNEVISGGDSPLRMLDAGQTQIMIEKSSVCIGALLVDRDLNVVRKALRDVVHFMEEEYPELEDWDGYSIDFSKVRPKTEEIFSEALEFINN